MRGRMPYPVPFLPMLIVVMVFSALTPTCFNFFSFWKKKQAPKETVPIEKNATGRVDPAGDPFSDSYDPKRQVAPVKIKNAYVEITSGVTELEFDWVMGPLFGEAPKQDSH